jgi:hypothetical protein
MGLGIQKQAWSEEQFIKSASKIEAAEAAPTRIKKASVEGEAFIKSAHDLSRGTFQAADGGIWAIELDADGTEWLVRNAQESEVNALTQQLI